MLLNELFENWRSVSRVKLRRRAQSRVQSDKTEPLEVRQLLTASAGELLDPTISSQFLAGDKFDQHVAVFTAPKNIESLRLATGASSVIPAQFLTNGYQFTFSAPSSLSEASIAFSAISDFDSFTPVFAQQRAKRFVPNDPLYIDQWHLNNTGQGGGTVGLDVNVDGVWDTYRGTGVVIGVVDDGVQLSHEDLAANVRQGLSWDFNGNDNDASPDVTADFHGTAVAGVAAGVGNNGLGVSGAAPEAGIAGLRLIAAPSTDLQEAQALTWLNNQIDIYNNSWGPSDSGRIAGIGPQAAAALAQGFATGRNGKGSIFAWAGGNGGNSQDNVNYDAYANSRYTIAIGALDQNGIRASYSEPGAPLIVTAYSQGNGIAITTTDLTGDNGYNAADVADGDSLANANYTSTFNGTSSATPLAAGVIALMLQANPQLTAREVQDILVHTARRTDLTNADWTQNGAGLWVNHNYGFGAIDAQAAVTSALNYVPLTAEISATTGSRNVSTAIPDGSGVVRSTVAVTDRISLEYVEIYFSATHTNRGQLNVTLISPSGTRSVLASTRTVDDNSDADPGYSNWRFTSARHWDESSEGTWTIEVSDPVTGEIGTFDSYELRFYGTTIDVPVPSKPQLIAPFGTIANIGPTYQWTTSTNAASYELEVTSSVGSIVLNRTGIAQTSFVQPGSLPEGTFSFRVRAVNSENEFSEWSDTAEFTIDIQTPVKPVLHRPTGNITDSYPEFGWSGDAFSATYTLWVNNATTGTRVIYRNAWPDTSYTHFAPLADGIYRAWVQAFNVVGETSGWSESVDFTVKTPLAVAPTITAPTPITSNTSPRIVWNAVNAAAKYDLWVDNLTTGTSKYIRQSEISYLTPWYDTTNLPQGTFRAWVRAANGNNEFSPWSDPYTFTVDILPPSTPSMVGPTGVNGIVNTTNPTFKWTSADRAATYDLWVNNVTTSQSQIIRQQNLSGTEYVALANLPQGLYHAWVRGINSVNEVGEWSARYTFNIDEPTPLIPVITAPVANLAGSVSNTNPTFVWSSDLNAPFYEFVLDDQTDRKYNVIRVTNVQTTSYTVPVSQTLVEHTYVAWVRGRNNSGEASSWSAPFQVRIDIPNPTTPTIVGPTGTSKDTTPTFQWTHTPGAVRYEILVRNLERGEDIVLQVSAFTLDPTGQFSFYTLPNNQAFNPATYRFWIRAFNSLGTASNWSSSRTFIISASLEVKDLKIVEPSRLLTAEAFFEIADERFQPAENVSETRDAALTSETRVSVPTSAAAPAASETAMPATLIEEVMESLSDPASSASAMLSGSLSSNSVAEPNGTPGRTMAAAMFAMTMLPVRRRRREESR